MEKAIRLMLENKGVDNASEIASKIREMIEDRWINKEDIHFEADMMAKGKPRPTMFCEGFHAGVNRAYLHLFNKNRK